MENYGETGMAHLLEHLMFKGTPHFPDPKKTMSDRGLSWNATTSYDRTNYFASMAENPDNLDFYLHWLSEATACHSFIAKKDLDSEMTVVRNEMERGENDPGNVLFQNVRADRVPLAQLRQADDRRALRRRERRHRAPAGLLSEVLPARQRGADRRRQVRRGEDARRSSRRRSASCRDRARARADLHARPDAGRRALGHAAPRRRHADPDRAVSPAGGLVARLRGRDARATMLGGPDFRLNKALVEKNLAAGVFGGARGLARSGLRVLRRATSKNDQSIDAGARRADRDDRGRRRSSRSPTPSSSARRTSGCAVHADAGRSATRRHRAVGVHRARRLAPRLRSPQSRDGCHRRRHRTASRPPTSCQRTARSASTSRAATPVRAPRSGRARRRQLDEGLQGRRRGRGRRGVRRVARQHRAPHDDRHAARRPASARAAAEVDARRQGDRAGLAASRRREVAVRQGRDRRGRPRTCSPRGTERLSREELSAAFERLQTTWAVSATRRASCCTSRRRRRTSRHRSRSGRKCCARRASTRRSSSR